MSAPRTVAAKAREWQGRLTITVTALLLVETVTGLAILLLPFSVPNQLMVLLHTGLGVALVAPYLWYQARHWWMYRSIRLSHQVLTGYFALAAAAVLVGSGLVLTGQALFATRIRPAWDLAHNVATFGLILAAVPHYWTMIHRAVRSRRAGVAGHPVGAIVRWAAWTGGLTIASFVLTAAGWLAYRPPSLANRFPADYSYLYGKDRPFAPSLARTASGGAYDSRTMAGSSGCGSGGCHQEIYDEWAVSAHRYAAMDPAFQKVQSVMGQQNGAESTRYCGGCHDPISLFSGTKNVFTDTLTSLAGYQEGVSCVACHSIRETDVKGNAAYVIEPPRRYLFELAQEGQGRAVRDFLIRAYPRYHIESLQHTLFKSPEFCAACHKQFIDEEINRIGWVQLQNQYDNWRKSRWNHPGDPTKTIECRECHMPLVVSRDPASGDERDYNRTPGDGRHRSHRFLAANQFMPLLLDLPGGARQARLTERWLRGEIEIPEIASKWKTGPAVPIAIEAPARARPGAPVSVKAVISNNKVGHDFPTGPLDIIQAWVELEVTDQTGRVVFQSGQRDSADFIAPGSFMLKAEPVDQYGNLIDRHNLWEMVGVRYRRSLFPGYSDQSEFTFPCPKDRSAELTVRARLMYRKIDQFLLNFLFGAGSGLTAPVTVMSEATRIIRVEGGA